VPLAGSLVLTSSLDVDRRFDARCLLLYDHSLQITIAVIDVTMPHKTTAFLYVFGGTERCGCAVILAAGKAFSDFVSWHLVQWRRVCVN
jgi:hypothetical protein